MDRWARATVAAPLAKLDDFGDQLSLYGRSIGWIPRTLRRYKKEIA
ncbi:MAG: ABC transporter permease, partial [Actinobacteria bacterium]|nr:ABC transporter permease [Actinomycetota bacterium]